MTGNSAGSADFGGSTSVTNRFLALVSRTDTCWLWAGTPTVRRDLRYSYGRFRFAGKVRRAHRVSWELANGSIPDGLFVCHHCDTPLCVRPDHLFLGTRADNFDDMRAKGRNSKGSRISRVLTEVDVAAIRRSYADGTRQRALAADYGVSPVTIHQIVHRTSWRHVA